jgi:hypothetical protein
VDLAAIDDDYEAEEDIAVTELSLEAGDITGLVNALDGNTVYVAGKMTLDGTTAINTGNARIMALSEVEAKGTVTLGPNTKVLGTLKPTAPTADTLTISAILGGANSVAALDLSGKTVVVSANAGSITKVTNTGTAAILTLAAAADELNTVEVAGAGNITIGGTTVAAFTVDKLSTPGAGHLVVPATAITLTITEADNGGKFAYAGAPASVDLGTSANVTIVTSTAWSSITGALAKTSGNLTVDGNLSAGGVIVAALTVNGDLTASGTSTITVTGDLKVTGSLALGGATTGALTVGGGEIGTLSSFTANAEIDVTDELTIGTVTGGITAKALVATGSGIVWVSGDSTLVTNVTANNIGFQGGALTNAATLASGVKLYVKDGGHLTIGASVQFILTDEDSQIILLPGGKIAFTTAAAFLKGTDSGDQTDITLTVANLLAPAAATWANVENTSGDYTVTTHATAGNAVNVVVGDIQFAFTNAKIDGLPGTDPAGAIGSITAGEDTIVFLGGNDD